MKIKNTFTKLNKNKGIALCFFLIFLLTNSVYAQVDKISVANKSGSLKIAYSAENYSADIMLSKPNVVLLTSLLKKGLEWNKINQQKRLNFSKRIGELSAKSTRVYNIGSNPVNYSSKIEVVFNSKGNDDFSIMLYADDRIGIISIDLKSTLPPFDIENPGATLIEFNSVSEVDKFISLINQRQDDINSIFK